MEINTLKISKVLIMLSFLIALSVFVTFFTNFGQSVVFADTGTSSSVVITLNVDAGIAISSPDAVSMSQNLSLVNMTAVASSTWTITTNNITGYNLTVKASTAPAMQQNATTTIADFSTTTTPALWSTVPSGTAQFGFSAYGTDVLDATWGAGASCQASANTPATDLKYLGFTTSTSTVVATRAATTTYAGSATTVCYAVEQKAFYVPSGTYTATITATAVTI